jgi:hypothetical protein
MRGKFLRAIDDVFQTVGPTILMIDEVELAHPVECVGDIKLFHQELPISSIRWPRKAFDRSRHPDDIGSISIKFLISKKIGKWLMKTKIHAIDYTGSTFVFCHDN